LQPSNAADLRRGEAAAIAGHPVPHRAMESGMPSSRQTSMRFVLHKAANEQGWNEKSPVAALR
jgi:hypothetical protein